MPESINFQSFKDLIAKAKEEMKARKTDFIKLISQVIDECEDELDEPGLGSDDDDDDDDEEFDNENDGL